MAYQTGLPIFRKIEHIQSVINAVAGMKKAVIRAGYRAAPNLQVQPPDRISSETPPAVSIAV